MAEERDKELENFMATLRKGRELAEERDKEFEELVQNEEMSREEKLKRYGERINRNLMYWAKIFGEPDSKKGRELDEKLNLKFDIAEEIYGYGNKKGIKLKRDYLRNLIVQEKQKQDYSLLGRGLNRLKRAEYPLYKPVIAADPNFKNTERIFYFSSEYEELAKRLGEILNTNEIKMFTGNTLKIEADKHFRVVVEPNKEYHTETSY